MGKKIVMLEPRRLAARRAAEYIASQLGEKTGQTAGYRIRGESVVGTSTRIEVVTEGVLTRLLHADPSLEGTGLLIFDEFHERSLHADLGLALALDSQEHLRDDLRILVMSATLDGVAVANLLGDAPVVESKGRVYPITTEYLPQRHDGPIEPLVTSAIMRAVRNETGDLLVFLPGQREIRRVETSLAEADLPPDVEIHTLYGDASPLLQKAALDPSPQGRRKIVLSTSIAETSLTIDGVRVVIDAGLARGPRFDPRRGMTGLVTTPVSQAAADQRRGRAGRQQPGVCYRLWTARQQELLPRYAQPEITVADLAPLALDLARWGSPDGTGLRFLDAPPAPHLQQAHGLLRMLGAIDAGGSLTPHGRAMADFPTHPRFAHMLLRGKELNLGSLACDLAALLDERDLLARGYESDIDILPRWQFLRRGGAGDRNARDRVRTQADRLRELLRVDDANGPAEKIGLLVSLAYPERVGKRRDGGSSRYQLSGGAGAILPPRSGLFTEEYLAVADVDGVGNEAKIFLASPVSLDDLVAAFGDVIAEDEDVRWDEREECIVARLVTRFGAIELSERAIRPSEEQVKKAVTHGIRLLGIGVLPWNKSASSFRDRSEWVRYQHLSGDDWPDLSDGHLLATLETWLEPFLDGVLRRTHFDRLGITDILRSLFSYGQLQDLDRLAPEHLTVPTGSSIPVKYSPGSPPVLAVRLQEMFGQTSTPAVGGGKVPVLLHLLSPANRPLAVTQDLPSFWKNAYPDVRKDMRGRYPKHHWPENPLEAEPTRRTKRKS
jgi:ATP-dependent helicase HrpB